MQEITINIRRQPYYRWFDIAHYRYLLAYKCALDIEGTTYQCDGFDGKLTRVKIGNDTKRYSINKSRVFRYNALKRRGSLCNHMNLKRMKYRYNIRDVNCEFCYISSNCNKRLQGYGGSMIQLIMRDIVTLSEFFHANRDLANGA